MKLSQAAKFLGISPSNLSNLVSSGKISVEDDPLDRRVKLVKRADLEEILHRRTGV
jgi:ribosomal protein L12E/L44/L45/RPP1/RPP2